MKFYFSLVYQPQYNFFSNSTFISKILSTSLVPISPVLLYKQNLHTTNIKLIQNSYIHTTLSTKYLILNNSISRYIYYLSKYSDLYSYFFSNYFYTPTHNKYFNTVSPTSSKLSLYLSYFLLFKIRFCKIYLGLKLYTLYNYSSIYLKKNKSSDLDITNNLVLINKILDCPPLDLSSYNNYNIGLLYPNIHTKFYFRILKITSKVLYFESTSYKTFINLPAFSLISNNFIFLSNTEKNFNSICDIYFKNILIYNKNSYTACLSTFYFMYYYLLESLYKQYLQQQIILPCIYFELIINKMCKYIKITTNNLYTKFILGDIIPLTLINIINNSLMQLNYPCHLYTPIILSITKSILVNSGYLTSISFQETLKYLINNTITNSIDWFESLKSQILTTQLLYTGTGWLRSFNSLYN